MKLRMIAPAGLFFAITLYAGCSGNGRPPAMNLGPDRHESDARQIISRSHVAAENTGYVLYDIKANEVVTSANRDVPFIPASTTKLFTAAAALDILGADYRFETALKTSGSIEKGVLKGDLCIVGGGDPSLTSDDLASMAEALAAKGIRSLSGRFLFDESAFPPSNTVEESMDDDAAYNAGISALSVGSNLVMASWKSRRGGRDTELVLTPSVPLFTAEKSEGGLPRGTDFKFDQRGDTETWIVRPAPAGRGKKFLPVKNAGLFTAQFFAKLCRIRGIELPPPVRGSLDGGDTIHVHRSGPLWEVLDPMLAYSNNVMSELVMIRSAGVLTKKSLPVRESAQAVARRCAGVIPRVDWKGFELANGSGLTTENRITPMQMAALLLHAEAKDYDGKRFSSLLPSSGWEHTLASRFNRPDTAFHLNAKTGTINYAVSLAGYLYTASHRKMVFVVFVHDTSLRKAFDAGGDRKDRAKIGRAAAWNARSKELIDSIVEKWVKQY